MEPVLYQPYDGAAGIELNGDELIMHSGEEVGRTGAPAGLDLAQILSRFLPLRLFPSQSFAYGPVRHFSWGIEVEIIGPREAYGWLSLSAERLPWQAELGPDLLFTEAAELPDGARPWIKGPGARGWRLSLPAAVANDPDPVVSQRIALALEELLAGSKKHAEGSFDTSFSSLNPTWTLNLPVVIGRPRHSRSFR